MTSHINLTSGNRVIIPYETEQHMLAHPDVNLELIREAFDLIDLDAAKKNLEVCRNLGRVIGVTGKIRTPVIAPADCALFAKRKARPYPSRVVVGMEKEPTSEICVVANRSNRDTKTFILRTAWLGELAPPEPFSLGRFGADAAKEEVSLAYWCSHALIYDDREFMDEPAESSWTIIVQQARTDRDEKRRLKNEAQPA